LHETHIKTLEASMGVSDRPSDRARLVLLSSGARTEATGSHHAMPGWSPYGCQFRRVLRGHGSDEGLLQYTLPAAMGNFSLLLPPRTLLLYSPPFILVCPMPECGGPGQAPALRHRRPRPPQKGFRQA